MIDYKTKSQIYTQISKLKLNSLSTNLNERGVIPGLELGPIIVNVLPAFVQP